MLKEKLIQYCVGLHPEQIQELRQMSEASSVPRSKMIRIAIDHFIDCNRADYLKRGKQ